MHSAELAAGALATGAAAAGGGESSPQEQSSRSTQAASRMAGERNVSCARIRYLSGLGVPSPACPSPYAVQLIVGSYWRSQQRLPDAQVAWVEAWGRWRRSAWLYPVDVAVSALLALPFAVAVGAVRVLALVHAAASAALARRPWVGVWVCHHHHSSVQGSGLHMSSASALLRFTNSSTT